jgi:flavin reductase (DIM6/NTAB) family NADH-FMN oxidoreductase RutF
VRELRIEGTSYPLLRHLTLPVVAVTTVSPDGHGNGMIANSAQRASLVPSIPRLSVYISKPNHSHELVMRSGVFGIHLLRTDQWDLIAGLGLRTGRDADKLAGLALHTGKSGCPLLVDCIAAYECRVVNAMDAGAATFFLGDIVSEHRGEVGAVMTSPYFRDHMPPDMKRIYESNLAHAMEYLEPLARTIDTGGWTGPVR